MMFSELFLILAAAVFFSREMTVIYLLVGYICMQVLLLRLYAIWVSLELVVYRIIERDLRAGFADHAGPPMHRLPEENANPQDDVPFPVQKLSGEAEADPQYQGVTDSL